MYTKNFSIFTQMVLLAKEQNLEYKILYSYRQRKSTNDFTEKYTFMLTTNLFSVTYEGNYTLDNTDIVKKFIENNNCIRLDFEIKPLKNVAELI